MSLDKARGLLRGMEKAGALWLDAAVCAVSSVVSGFL